MTEQEKITIIEEILEVESGDITKDTVLEELEEWDSLSKLSLIGIAKKKFNKRLTISEIKSFKTIGDICDYL